MKRSARRIIGLLVSFSMILAATMPGSVWAAESCTHHYDKDAVCTNCPDVRDLTDLQKDAWAAYWDLRDVYSVGDFDGLKAAVKTFSAACEELEMDEQLVFEEMDKDFIQIVYNANVVMTANEYYAAYVADPNAGTAYAFISYYGMDDVQSHKSDIERFITDIADVYTVAQGDMPTGNALSVYEAYVNVQNALAFPEDMAVHLPEVIEAFEAVLDTFNTMISDEGEEAQKDRADLASLLAAEDEEAAMNQVLNDWVHINVLLEVSQAYETYFENPKADTATAFIEKYNGIFNDKDYEDEELRSLVEDFYPDIHELYADALALIAGENTNKDEDLDVNENKDEESKENNLQVDSLQDDDLQTAEQQKIASETAEKEDGESAPKTGDDSAMLLWLTMLLCAGIVAGGIKARQKVD